jgi:hypothetical protein
MSTARLDIWCLRRDEPCLVEDRFEHFVYVVDCKGNPIVWCGTKYVELKTKCGHLEIEVPPGCYFVGAVTNPYSAANEKYRPFGNHLTHVAMVRVNCGDHACVSLFDPTFHYCGTWFDKATVGHLGGGIRGELGEAMQTARPALARLVAATAKQDPDPFTINLTKALETRQPKGKKR